MKQSLFLLAFSLSLLLSNAYHGAAQSLPSGYKLLEDAPASVSISADLDGDGKRDAFRAVVRSGGEDAQLMAQLANGKTLTSGALSMCCGSISAKGGVVDVHSKGMRGFAYYKFRWEAAAGDFRLIGYDTESFGNAANDGSGTSSLNLLTGSYEAAFNNYNEKQEKLIALPKVKRKIAVSKKIYLRSFNETADSWLADLNAKYLPKEVR